jgi:hypothetical protein
MNLNFWEGTVEENRDCPHAINHERVKRQSVMNISFCDAGFYCGNGLQMKCREL